MIYNPLSKNCKSVLGAIRQDEKVIFRVYGDYLYCNLILQKDERCEEDIRPLTKKQGYFEIQTEFTEIGLFWYSFDVGNGNFIYCGNNLEGEICNTVNYYQLTVYKKDFITPEWIKGGVIYQIFPDRFYKSGIVCDDRNDRIIHKNMTETPVFMPDINGEIKNNDFFGGNFNGIIDKLDYLFDLGVNTIYLNPVFKAYSNHRYDTGDYMQIDSLLGSLDDFKKLIIECDRRGIKIILDGVFNHTGSDSLYFNREGNYNSLGAYQSKNSPYYSWYNFLSFPNKYESWWGIKTLPQVNETDVGYIEFICGKNGVIQTYSKLGIGGWRLDVVDELPDNFVENIRKAVKSVNNENIVIGEVWEDASNKISYGKRRQYFWGSELDSVMNYPLKNAILDFVCNKDCKQLIDCIYTQLDHYPKQVLHSLMNMLSTHDTFRLISAVSGVDISGFSMNKLAEFSLDETQYNLAKTRVKIASLLQFSLYGVPSIYYGDEIGMQGYFDPLNRKFFMWDSIDYELLAWYKTLGKMRKDFGCFAFGETKIIYANNGAIVYSRESEDCELLFAINLNECDLRLGFGGKLTNLLSNTTYENNIILHNDDFGIYYHV